MAAQGYLGLTLHAHLPFVRHPEHARSLEERWLFEAMVECYLPLLHALDRLSREGIPSPLTMSMTPPLLSMLADELLRRRFDDHLRRLETLAEREMVRLFGNESFAPLATHYRDHFRTMRGVWDRASGDLTRAFVRHWNSGRVELLACSATHAYLPGLLPTPEGIFGQLSLGMAAFEQYTGRRAAGAWLAECAYDPSFDKEIARAGIRYSLLDTHGLLHAHPRPPFGVFAPVISPSGVAFFGRDPESSRQVWSRDEGYPGDAYYRDFYRDIGFDLHEHDLLGEHLPEGKRLMTGIKYHRITGKSVDKAPYMPGIAEEKAWEHAGNFVYNRVHQIRHLAENMPIPPIVVSPYDAELFGHWWFEGPLFLENVFRRLKETSGELEAITLGQYLEQFGYAAEVLPAASTWGDGGYGEVWVGAETGWVWRHIHHATRYVTFLVRHFRDLSPARKAALRQAIVELLLLQSSDFPFIMKTGTMVDYAHARVRAHTHRLRHLGHLVQTGDIGGADEAWLSALAARDNFLSGMPFEVLAAPFA